MKLADKSENKNEEAMPPHSTTPETPVDFIFGHCFTLSNIVSGKTLTLTPTITLTSPNGGETWQRGTTHTVTWTYSNITDTNVKITLLKAGTEIGTIIDSTPIGTNGTGSYSWDIYSASTNVGNNFSVKIQGVSQSTISDVSNAYFTLTLASAADTTLPSQITNLSTSNLTQNTVTLNWTAPGDDGSTGTATSYDIRYSTATITSSNWASATQVTGEPTPLASGTSQTFNVPGLTANTTYYFAIRATDDAGNIGALSNILSAKTYHKHL
jgi:hypothetical protein